MICDYGCGQDAKFQLKNEKWCCSDHWSHCINMKRKCSERNKGEKNPFYGRKHDQDTKVKIGSKNTGRIKTTEELRKLSLAFMGKNNPNFGKDHHGKNNPMFGKKRLDASIRMSGKNNIAKRIDVREKLKISKIGYKPVPHSHSEKTKLKMREIALNRSEEVKEKMREAAKNSHSLEKACLARRIKIDKKYEWFTSQLITELKNSNGVLEINEIYKIFSNNPIRYIKSAMVIMKKKGLIYSIPKASKSLIVLNKK